MEKEVIMNEFRLATRKKFIEKFYYQDRKVQRLDLRVRKKSISELPKLPSKRDHQTIRKCFSVWKTRERQKLSTREDLLRQVYIAQTKSIYRKWRVTFMRKRYSEVLHSFRTWKTKYDLAQVLRKKAEQDARIRIRIWRIALNHLLMLRAFRVYRPFMQWKLRKHFVSGKSPNSVFLKKFIYFWRLKFKKKKRALIYSDFEKAMISDERLKCQEYYFSRWDRKYQFTQKTFVIWINY
jgi:hypothetical protein